MSKETIKDKLNDIQVKLAVIEEITKDIRKDNRELEYKIKDHRKDINDLKDFKSKAVGASMIGIPIIGMILTIGHEIIKKYLGWF